MKKTIFSFIVFSFVAQGVFAGGPWPKEKGKAYIKLSEWWTIFDQHYTDQGFTDPNVTTGVFNTTLYAEYGLTDRLTTIVNAPLFSRNYMNNIRSNTTKAIITEGEALNNLGDIDLGIKYGLTSPGAKFPIALSVTLGLPTGKIGGGSQGNLQTGDGEFNQLLLLESGTGFKIGKSSAYVSAYTGFNNRTNGYSEEFRYGLEFGVQILNQKLWINSRLTAVESFKNGDTAATNTSTSIFANNSEFTSVGIELNYYLSNTVGISAGVAGALRGEIIAAAPAYSVGIFYDMK